MVAAHTSAQALALRCRVVLACAEGGNNAEVAARLGVHRETVPRPFVWHKTSDQILDSLANYCRRISDSGH